MLDFRLKVFYTVAKQAGFTRAARELYISQPAITKHIKELESTMDVRLFERSGSKIFLTQTGKVLFSYIEKVIELNRELEYELGLLKEKVSGQIRLGASTTVAQYVLPAALAVYHERFPEVKIQLLTNNTQAIEEMLLRGEIDMGLVEGKSHRNDLQYKTFMADELVLVAHQNNKKAFAKEISLAELRNFDLVMREPGSGTSEVIEAALQEKGVKFSDLKIVMQLGSPESIKSFLEHSSCLAFLSKLIVKRDLENGMFQVIPVKDLAIIRSFDVVLPLGKSTKIIERFYRFLLDFYNFR
ncbi:LysR family transcriptional regulator [Solitalea lacus]|uniref:LysR family transcriptional regulator n=1 Tax=Solitalea lacus TaxID=2911172 RepID=UPI001EDA6CE2|nr:LysR family transcriptional regulator [Solitalea lacus]UKJ06423.1 LysR substrate-binding domain-containing protein [Solitalea lacus]